MILAVNMDISLKNISYFISLKEKCVFFLGTDQVLKYYSSTLWRRRVTWRSGCCDCVRNYVAVSPVFCQHKGTIYIQ
jgi:hypothetical protein